MFGSFYYPSCIFGELYLARLTALYQSIRSLWSTHHLFLRWLSQLHCHDRCDSQMTEQLYGLLPGCVSPSTLYSRTSAFIQQHGHMLFESKKLVVYCVKAIWYCDVIDTADNISAFIGFYFTRADVPITNTAESESQYSHTIR